MTSEPTTPTDRLTRIAESVASHRTHDDSDRAVFEADGKRITYADRTITLELTDTERKRLVELLGSFPVFKIEQPATRKAPEGEIHISAIADPKHTADFLERVFRSVYKLDEQYLLRAEEA